MQGNSCKSASSCIRPVCAPSSTSLCWVATQAYLNVTRRIITVGGRATCASWYAVAILSHVPTELLPRADRVTQLVRIEEHPVTRHVIDRALSMQNALKVLGDPHAEIERLMLP